MVGSPSLDSNNSQTRNPLTDLCLSQTSDANCQLVYHNIQQLFNRLNGGAYVERSEPAARLLRPASHRVPPDREIAIVAAYQSGASLRQVAAQLDISPHCVANCLHRTASNVNAKSRSFPNN